MLIAPEVDMVGKEIDTHTHGLDAAELRFGCRLAVINRVAMVNTRLGIQRMFDRLKVDFDRGIAVAVAVDLYPLTPVESNQFHQ